MWLQRIDALIAKVVEYAGIVAVLFGIPIAAFLVTCILIDFVVWGHLGSPLTLVLVVWIPSLALWVLLLCWLAIIPERIHHRARNWFSGLVPPEPLWPGLGRFLDRAADKIIDASYDLAATDRPAPLRPLDGETYEQVLRARVQATLKTVVATINTLPEGNARRNRELHGAFMQLEKDALDLAARLREQATLEHFQTPAPSQWAAKYRAMVATPRGQ